MGHKVLNFVSTAAFVLSLVCNQQPLCRANWEAWLYLGAVPPFSFRPQERGHAVRRSSHSDSSGQCAMSSETSSLQAVPAMSYLVPYNLHPGWVTRPFAGMFPPCQPARAQALLSTEHSQIHKQLSACDTTSSLWEQITQCVCSKRGSCSLFSVSAHGGLSPAALTHKWDGAVGFVLRQLPCSSLECPSSHSRYLRWVLDHHKLHTKKCVRVQIEQEPPWKGLLGRLKEETTCLEDTISFTDQKHPWEQNQSDSKVPVGHSWQHF